MKRILKIGLITLFITVLGLFVSIDYYLIMPSRAVELGQIITVENRERSETGSFYLLTVSQQQANLSTVVYGLINPQVDIRPSERVIPVGMEESEYRQQLEENMIESRYISQVVALRRVGYDVEIVSDGIEVVGLIPDAPAEDSLMEGDIMRAVNGQAVNLAGEAALIIQQLPVGETVLLDIVRDGEELQIGLNTGSHPDIADASFLGIYLSTLNWEPVLPLVIDMETGRIGGPSAGLMFTLEIINQLTDEDLTAGHLIAGSGTIDLDENVGNVGGIKQKVISAEREGAAYFFVPQGNREDAEKAARRIEVISVETLQDALDFLAGLE